MPDSESSDRLRHFLRATFPYLVLSGLFLLGMLVLMVWAFHTGAPAVHAPDRPAETRSTDE